MTSPVHVDCSCRFCSAMRSGHLSPAMGVPVVDDGEVARLRAEVERLGAALVYYGGHTWQCASIASELKNWTTADGPQCTCGFLDVLADAKGR